MLKKIVVLISGNGSNLQAIIDACAVQDIAGQVVAVISNKADAFGLTRAKNHNIAHRVVDHQTYEDRTSFDAQLQQTIDLYEPDLVVLAGFMRILTANFVDHYAGRMLNIHPSLLPKYQGLNTHQRAIDAGDTVHGVSVHFVTPTLDGGPVILQAKVPIFEDDIASDLAARVHQQEYRAYPLVINWFCQDRLSMRMKNDQHQCVLDGNVLGPCGYADE